MVENLVEGIYVSSTTALEAALLGENSFVDGSVERGGLEMESKMMMEENGRHLRCDKSPAAFDVFGRSRAGLGIRLLAARIRLPSRIKMTIA